MERVGDCAGSAGGRCPLPHKVSECEHSKNAFVQQSAKQSLRLTCVRHLPLHKGGFEKVRTMKKWWKVSRLQGPFVQRGLPRSGWGIVRAVPGRQCRRPNKVRKCEHNGNAIMPRSGNRSAQGAEHWPQANSCASAQFAPKAIHSLLCHPERRAQPVVEPAGRCGASGSNYRPLLAPPTPSNRTN